MAEPKNVKLDTYGDLKKVINTIIGKQKRSALVGTGKEEILGAAIDVLGSVFPGVSAAKTAVNFFKAAYSAPDTQKSKTWVDKINVDDEISKIVDDTIENKYLQDLIKNIESKPDEESLPNDFNTTKDLMNYIADKHQNRTIKAPGIEENKTILKYLLEVENEDPKTFEENPMEFILDKYVSLNEIMTELMTKDYREYLDAVFIVSPKPTSFKIILHNGQYFYMTYMGPAYEASVSGKNYYLSNIGEKERCMIAISKLLRGGSPLKTKGPEGAEQEASAEEGGGSSLSASGGAEETEGGGEEAPQLTESISLLKRMLLESIKEEKNIKLLDALMSNIGGAKNSKKGTHLRGDYGDEQEARKKIASAMKSLGVKDSDYIISTVYPGDFEEGSKSSSFNTYKIEVKKQNPAFSKGEIAYVVSREAKASAEGYLLKPQDLQVPNKPINRIELADAMKSGIVRNKALSTLQKKYLVQLINQTVSLSASDKKQISSDRNFINQVEKNFGEMLGAIYMLSKNPKYKVEFPAIGNFPLVDFFLRSKDDTISVSSKAGSTSGNTVKVQNVLQNAKESGVKIESKLKNILEILATASVANMPVMAADEIGTPELKALKNKYVKSKSGKDLYNLEAAVVRYINENYGEKIQNLVSKSIGSIVYVKTKIGADLTPDYIVKKPEALKFKLRSKNSQNRFSDRVGFDVK